jgi:hypothetical protein
MSHSVSVKPDSNPPSQAKPLALNSLSDPPTESCSRATQQQIDLMMLALEALELGGAEKMLAIAQELELDSIITNKVVFWRLRCTNPWRRTHFRRSLQIDQAKALTLIICYRARQLTVLIRQLLLAEQQLREKGLPLDSHFRLSTYLEQFRAHFRSRMNPRRAKISVYLASEEKLDELALLLLNQLLFCTGTMGMQRFWISLFDGEVA